MKEFSFIQLVTVNKFLLVLVLIIITLNFSHVTKSKKCSSGYPHPQFDCFQLDISAPAAISPHFCWDLPGFFLFVWIFLQINKYLFFFPVKKHFLVFFKMVSVPKYNAKWHFETTHQIYAKTKFAWKYYSSQFGEKSQEGTMVFQSRHYNKQ